MNTQLSLLLIGAVACAPRAEVHVAGPAAVVPTTPAPVDDPVDPPDVEPDPVDVPADIVDFGAYGANEEDAVDALERLAGLELLVVTDLVVDAPMHSGNCYSLPCPSDPGDQRWMQEHAAQVSRLVAFVEIAETIAAGSAVPVDYDAFDETETVGLLNTLEILDVEQVQWETGGSCYVGLCPGDDMRRDRLLRLVAATEEL